MASSSTDGFSPNSGVNTWGAVRPGLLWGQRWVKLGQDVAAGRSLQLQTPMTRVTFWVYHIRIYVPQNCSTLGRWFKDTYRMCFFSAPGTFKKSKEKLHEMFNNTKKYYLPYCKFAFCSTILNHFFLAFCRYAL